MSPLKARPMNGWMQVSSRVGGVQGCVREREGKRGHSVKCGQDGRVTESSRPHLPCGQWCFLGTGASDLRGKYIRIYK